MNVEGFFKSFIPQPKNKTENKELFIKLTIQTIQSVRGGLYVKKKKQPRESIMFYIRFSFFSFFG